MDLIQSTFETWSNELLDAGVILSMPPGDKLWMEFTQLPQSANLKNTKCPFDTPSLKIWETVYMLNKMKRKIAAGEVVSGAQTGTVGGG